VAHGLEADEVATERLAIVTELDGLIQHPLGAGNRRDGADQAFALEVLHDVVEAGVLVTQQVLRGIGSLRKRSRPYQSSGCRASRACW
jgi:hypothetical protein